MSANDKGLAVIVTGVTGMVGEGVLLECIASPEVARILVVARRPTGVTDPKVKELVVPSFLEIDGVKGQLAGYDACFYCAGVSSVGMSEEDYTKATYDTPVHFAKVLSEQNPNMVICHVTGASTDGTEQGKLMWARVKGRAENALMRMPFKGVYNFRPGFMRATPGQRNIKWYYWPIGWMYPFFALVLPNKVSTLQEVGAAMIKSVTKGYPKQVLEIADINALAKS
jgi:hypothetical protein